MVRILTICVFAMAILALFEFVMLYMKIVQVWRLEEELDENRAIEPIIDKDGRWTDWDER